MLLGLVWGNKRLQVLSMMVLTGECGCKVSGG